MLDFYWIPDDETPGEDPNEGRYIGSLSLEDFMALAALWEHAEKRGIVIKFFEDRRITSAQTRTLQGCLKSFYGQMAAVPEAVSHVLERVSPILARAIHRGAGIYTFAD